eukprot:scaffold34947_cov62-Phaeocystis_antarctica.AAC.1
MGEASRCASRVPVEMYGQLTPSTGRWCGGWRKGEGQGMRGRGATGEQVGATSPADSAAAHLAAAEAARPSSISRRSSAFKQCLAF